MFPEGSILLKTKQNYLFMKFYHSLLVAKKFLKSQEGENILW